MDKKFMPVRDIHQVHVEVDAQALELAAASKACFPCHLDKRPATPHGFLDATQHPAELRDLFRRYPARLIGVATGAVSGLDVLDADAKHKSAHSWWHKNRNRLPKTLTHRTRSGGLHLFFQHCGGMRNSAGRIASGIDVRGDGGYVIWWPAAKLPVLCRAPLAPWPAWLAAELQSPRPGEVSPPALPSASKPARPYAIAALRRAVQRIATAAEGQRNHILNAEAFRLARFVVEDVLSPNELAEAMAHAALASGLPPVEIQRTIASALGAGVAK